MCFNLGFAGGASKKTAKKFSTCAGLWSMSPAILGKLVVPMFRCVCRAAIVSRRVLFTSVVRLPSAFNRPERREFASCQSPCWLACRAAGGFCFADRGARTAKSVAGLERSRVDKLAAVFGSSAGCRGWGVAQDSWADVLVAVTAYWRPNPCHNGLDDHSPQLQVDISITEENKAGRQRTASTC